MTPLGVPETGARPFSAASLLIFFSSSVN